MHCLNNFYTKRGFILLMTLIFMQIMVLLNWCVLEQVLLSKKSSKNFIYHDRAHSVARKILSDLESLLVNSSPSCVIPATDSRHLMQHSLAWWQSPVVCSGNFKEFQYYYVVEFLARDECAIIDSVQSMAIYFRITLLLISPLRDEKNFFQMNVITADANPAQHVCHGLQHSVRAGHQAWFELSMAVDKTMDAS